MAKTAAVESLVELGLTEYEARCYVAITQLTQGTAKEISQVSDVPQSRVYDVAARLHERGLVDVQESEPRRYFAVPVKDALERLQQTYHDSLETAEQHLQSLESRENKASGVWQIANQEDILLRMTTHIEEAQDEIFLVLGDDSLLDRDVLETLADASDRGVTIYAEVISEEGRDRLHDAVPDCGVTISDLPISAIDKKVPGRLVLADQDAVVLSALTEGLVPGETEETGIWGNDVDHGLVAWLVPLLEERRERQTFETASST